MFRVVHYLNQFFGQIGGEDYAGVAPQKVDKPIGPGLALKAALGDKAQVVGTVICGDNYFAEHNEKAVKEVIELIKTFQPHLVIAGPAFNAGRYGPACAAVCKAVGQELGIPAVTGMYPENPGVEMYRRDIICVGTGPSAAGMRQAIPLMAALGLKLASGEKIGSPDEEGYLPHGIRINAFAEKNGAARAVDMLLAKLQGVSYRTELPMPSFEIVQPAAPVADLSKATIALVTEGGIVPKGNPDRLESARATKFLKYSLQGIDDLSGNDYQSVHGGYSNVFANEDPDRVLPVDVMRDCVREAKIGSLYGYFFTTTGNGTTLENGRKFGQDIAGQLKKDGVDGVILTSTWGTGTRCGATITKELERAGIPTVQICTIVPIALSIGANRIVPAVAIPHPLGNPHLSPAQEKLLRRKLVDKALSALQKSIENQTVFSADN